MQIFRTVADYTFGQADIIRKAMSKKQAGKIEQERNTFLAKAAEKGIDEIAASELFEELVGFCKYAFNKSHAASYAYVTYRTAYLKCHYPKEYMASLLTSVIGDEDKVVMYSEECKRMGIEILPPQINESGGDFRVVGDNIRFPLLAIKNVGKNFVEDVVNTRKKGLFTSFEDFVGRMRESDLNKRQIESLIKVGCFDFAGVYRSQLLAVYEKLIEGISETNRKNALGQLDFFSVDPDNSVAESQSYKYPEISEFAAKEKLLYEKECTGFYFSGNLLDDYSRHEADLQCVSIKSVVESFDVSDGDEIVYGTKAFRDGQKIRICGIVNDIVSKNTRKGDKMCFLTVEDRNKKIEVVVFPSVLEEYGYMLTRDSVLAVYGEISARVENEVKIIMNRSEILKNNDIYISAPKPEPKKADFIGTPKPPKSRILYLRVEDMECKAFKKAVNLLEIFEGNTKVVFYDSSKKVYVAANGRSVDLSDKIIGFFSELLGKDNVILK